LTLLLLSAYAPSKSAPILASVKMSKKMKDYDGVEHAIPIELVELIREKPEVSYLMLLMTTKHLFQTSRGLDLEQPQLDEIIWQMISSYDAGEAIEYPKEIN